jgi:hypothetical protein
MKRFLAALILACGVALATLTGLASSAGASNLVASSCYPSCSVPDGGANGVPVANQTPADNEGSATVTPASTTSGSLAFTGTDVAGTVVLGGALIGGGALMVRVSRRRRQAA